MATRKIAVRVMNDPKNKRTFKKFRMEEFPVMDFNETTQKLVDIYGEYLGFHEKESAEIGYVGYSNKKYKIESNDDLQKAFESGDLHMEKQPVFYICRKQEEKAIKRPAEDFGNVSVSDDSTEKSDDDSAKTKKRRKQTAKEKSSEKIIERLRSIQGENWGLGEYRLWAVALERGYHDSYQEPPDYPVFSNRGTKEKKKKSSELSQALSEVASAFLNSRSDSNPGHTQQASSTIKTYDRTERLKQLQMVGELHQGGCLTKEEFEEQKRNILKDMSKC